MSNVKERKLFLVDDEAIIVLELSEYLKRQGYSIAGMAYDVKTALKRAAGKDFDLAILDLNIHGENTGIDLAKTLCSEIDTPVIFISGNSERNVSSLLEKQRFSFPYSYMIKPFNKHDLQRTITKHLS